MPGTIGALALVLCACAPSSGTGMTTSAPGGEAVPMIPQGARADSSTVPTARVPSSSPLDLLDGTWYLVVGDHRETLSFGCYAGDCQGTLTPEYGGGASSIDQLAWNAATSLLTFRAGGDGTWRFFRLRVGDGVVTGRVAIAKNAEPDNLTPARYLDHVTGWNAAVFDRVRAPRVFDLQLEGGEKATVRIDVDPDHPGGYLGRIKVYATESSLAGAEADEYDAVVDHWDGDSLELSVPDEEWQRVLHGSVDGRRIDGTWSAGPEYAQQYAFHGTRSQVLSHGFTPRGAEEREAWQAATRARLRLLMQDGAPQPLSQSVVEVRSGVEPIRSSLPLIDRDDGAFSDHPQRYHLAELVFDVTLPDPWGGDPIHRSAHAWFALPDEPPPPSGYPVVLALNGHTGSGYMTMNPDSEYFWYGDAYARRGYAVLAIDIGHRPWFDRQGLYDGYDWGDDTDGGNGLHPAIESPNLDSDWEEDGERVFDVQRGLDWLLARADVDPRRVVVSGLSMGGEITTFAGALEPRLQAVVAAGFSPDIDVLFYRGSHGCWQWAHGAVREWLDTSDLHALVAPRPLLVETGRADVIYSLKSPPFSGDLQVMRRSRAAWSDAPDRLVHYLHYDVHHFHVGGAPPAGGQGSGVQEAVGPDWRYSADASWQDAPESRSPGVDLFGLLDRWLPSQ